MWANMTIVKKGDFCGPAGGAPAGSYPVNTLSRAKSALKLAHNAPNPQGIKNCVYRKYPELKPGHAKGGPTYKEGGSVGNKISKLKDEGKSQDQAVAIALSMKERGKYKKGGKTLCSMGYKKGGKMNYLEYRNMHYPLGFGGSDHAETHHKHENHHEHEKYHQGYDDRQDESISARDGKESTKKVSKKGRRDDSFGKWGKRGKEDRNKKFKTGGMSSESILDAAMRDDAAHMSYLKRDIEDDNRYDPENNINMTADEQHITNLAQDLKDDKKKKDRLKKKRKSGGPALKDNLYQGGGMSGGGLRDKLMGLMQK